MAGERSAVYTNEVDASFAAQILASTYGVVLGAAHEGPLDPQFVVDPNQIPKVYGAPSPSIGSGIHYPAIDFLKEGGGVWMKRVTSRKGSEYGATVISVPAATSTTATAVPTTADAEYLEDMTVGGLGGVGDISLSATDRDLMAIYAIGPGAYSSNIAVEIQSQNLIPPTATDKVDVSVPADANLITPGSGDGVTADTDGELSIHVSAATSYNIKVASIGRLGETLPGTAVVMAVPVTAGTEPAERTRFVAVEWGAVPGAHAYAVYGAIGATAPADTAYMLLGETSGTEFVWNSKTAGELSAATGHVAKIEKPDGTDFDINTHAPLPINYFDLLVYDYRNSRFNPQETFEVSLAERVDGMGESSEIEERVNSQSKLVRVKSGASALTLGDIVVRNMSKTVLSAGVDANDIDSADLEREVALFQDKVAYPASLFLDGGLRSPAWQKALDVVCHARQDSTCHTAVPASKQKAVDAVNYRIRTLNANSNRMGLYVNDHLVSDPYSGKKRYASASSVGAARIAFTDRTRNAGFSHAGFKRGVPRDTLALRERYTDAERDLMALNRVNYFTTEPGFGFPLRESYTQQSLFSSLSFMSVRRVLDIIEQSSQRALRAYLQDPNDDITAGQIVANVVRLLRVMSRRRMIFPDFIVHSDTPPEEVQLGNLELITVLKPRLPIIRIRHTVVIANQAADLTALLEQFLAA